MVGSADCTGLVTGGDRAVYILFALPLPRRMRVYRTTQQALAAVRAGTVLAFLTDYPTLEFYASALPCDVTVGGQPFGPNSISLGLPRGSVLMEPLNQAILKVQITRAPTAPHLPIPRPSTFPTNCCAAPAHDAPKQDELDALLWQLTLLSCQRARVPPVAMSGSA